MQLSAELSLYPLAGDVNANVLAFIEDLIASERVSLVTNSMSTQVTGEAEAVFTVVREALEQSYRRAGRQVLVAKFIPEHRLEIGAP